MTNPARRPFYGEFAWAFDLIITAPVQARCAFWSEIAAQKGIREGARILDAGCGSGGYALELARMGYAVTAIDVSPELIAIARAKLTDAHQNVSFSVADILELPEEPRYDGVLCRGVLNDFVTDVDRQEACARLGRVLRENGLLVLDVREWHATVKRKTKKPVFERTLETEKGTLYFRSQSELDSQTRQLIVSEQHVLTQGNVQTFRTFCFVMRCWTQDELRAQLTRAGFGSMRFFGDYNVNAALGVTDRIVAVACRGN